MILAALVVRSTRTERKEASSEGPLSIPSGARSQASAKHAGARGSSIDLEHERDAFDDRALAARVTRWRATADIELKGSIQKEIEALLTSGNARNVLDLLAPDLLSEPLALEALEKWAEAKPAEAMAWLESKNRFQSNDALVETGVAVWLRQDIDGLCSYLVTLGDRGWKQGVLAAVCRSELRQDLPEDAALWLLQLPEQQRPSELADAIAQGWGKKDFGAATSWIMSQRDPALQDRLLANMLGGYAQRNPAGAAEFAQNVFPSGKELGHVTDLIVAVWARVDARAAADWVAQLPEAEVRGRSLNQLMPKWLAADPAAARNWVLAQPATEERTESVQRILQWSTQNNPAIAAELLEHIPPDEMRTGVRIGIVRQWARWDLAGASRWVSQMPPGPLQRDALFALSSAASEPRDIPF